MRASEFVTERKSPEDIYLDALARLARSATKRYKRERLRQHVNAANSELNQLDTEASVIK